MQEQAYMGLPHCGRLSNGTVEAVVSLDVGPRVLRYGLVGGDNVFGEYPHLSTPTELGDWKPYGGHRLWAAPEAMPRSYAPDNTPIQCTPQSDLCARLTQPTDAVGLQKEITVTLAPQGTSVALRHTLTNHNRWTIPLAPWCSTIMRGGTAIIPQEPFRSHDNDLSPSRPLALWSFTDLSDPRWAVGGKLIWLRADADRREPQKMGALNKQGWCAYHRQGTLFVKRFAWLPGQEYPDFGCNNAVYAAGDYMEIESLGSMQALEPGATAHHAEWWHLFSGVTLNEDEMAATLAPLIAQTTPAQDAGDRDSCTNIGKP